MCWPFKNSRPTVCNHKYKGFPWYITIGKHDSEKYEYRYDWRYTLKVTAPYVCVKCKHRRDEILGYFESNDCNQRDERVAELQAQYPEKIKPSLEIEGMIKDAQLVDEEYLRLIDEFYHPQDTFDRIDLFSELQKVKTELAETARTAQDGG